MSHSGRAVVAACLMLGAFYLLGIPIDNRVLALTAVMFGLGLMDATYSATTTIVTLLFTAGVVHVLFPEFTKPLVGLLGST